MPTEHGFLWHCSVREPPLGGPLCTDKEGGHHDPVLFKACKVSVWPCWLLFRSRVAFSGKVSPTSDFMVGVPFPTYHSPPLITSCSWMFSQHLITAWNYFADLCASLFYVGFRSPGTLTVLFVYLCILHLVQSGTWKARRETFVDWLTQWMKV